MGATKRFAELILQSLSEENSAKEGMKITMVRFGNVLGSSGSAIPLFQKQIREGGPLTVTDPKVIRYFMSISEAAQLILQAGTMGDGGEIYVLDMGSSVNIKDIAFELIRLSGLEPEKDISIEYIGMRPGEKMFEELRTDEENIIDTGHDKILMMKNENGSNWDYLLENVSEVINSAQTYDINKVTDELKKFIPEYVPDPKSINQDFKSLNIGKFFKDNS